MRFAQVTAERNALDPKTRELILLAVNASTTTLHEPSIRWHMQEAIRHGATEPEIAEILELVSVLAIHTASTGMPILLDTLQQQRLLDSAELDERRRDLKERYLAGRGMWNAELEAMLVLDPDLLEAYLAFSSVPWRTGTLGPAIRELVYIAIDSSVTHMYHSGTRIHMERALAAGATPAQIAGVLTLVSTLGEHTLTSGLRILREVTA